MCWRSGLTTDPLTDDYDMNTDVVDYENNEVSNLENSAHHNQIREPPPPIPSQIKKPETSAPSQPIAIQKHNYQQQLGIGEKTRQAVLASGRRMNKLGEHEALQEQQTKAVARALEILEKRLRMNEDKVAQLEQSGLSTISS
mmetsp:Transcript_31575/g.38902  ORF Transcript_31575/g.38902 Transcript_31575/m.38902 type:complete len:142 (+) Transcript_31575:721-1146(+)